MKLFIVISTIFLFTHCNPSKEIQVTEETWEVVKIQKVYRYNMVYDITLYDVVTFNDINNKTEFTLHRAKPGSYHVGQVLRNLSRR